ncbi:hypothetical protein BpHYR1_007712 [Brachionus plicatilis]|uniref:Uncharacterized protein n=1 Tax=Brachionus plicatilis TaxID=10195 RepID=A0A3M7Q4F9_BRAPC|nr:hypothetical protein BpHYR1_007712 [Brachionus plicatilis]
MQFDHILLIQSSNLIRYSNQELNRGFGFQSNKKEKNDNDAKSGGNKTKFSNASVKTCNISSSLEPENEANRNEANLVDLNYVEQLSGQENDSRNISAIEFGILTNQINDINNNLVKINDDVNSMGSDEIDFPDYEYSYSLLLGSRAAK